MPNSFNSNMPLLPRAIYKLSTVRVVTNFDLGCTHFATFFSNRSSSLFELWQTPTVFQKLCQSPISLFVKIASSLDFVARASISCTSKNRELNTDFANSFPLFNLLSIANFQNSKLFYNSCFGKFEILCENTFL